MAIDVRLARIRGRSCCSVSTDDHFDLPYEALLRTAEPQNWSAILPRRFIDMVPRGLDDYGWTCVVEHGTYAGLTHRTPLKFWKEPINGDLAHGYRIDYDLDAACDPGDCDHFVTRDNGFIRVVPEGDGVAVRTVKMWHIAGTWSWLAVQLVPMMGWGEITGEFFRNAAALDGPVAPFEVSGGPGG
jgi:hypothetical protein